MPGRLDWAGTLTFGLGLTVLLTGITYGIQPYGESSTGWTNPWVLGAILIGLTAGGVLLDRVGCPADVQHSAVPVDAFGMSNLAGLMASVRPGRPAVHADHLVAGHLASLAGLRIRIHPTLGGHLHAADHRGFLVSGPIAGSLSDRFGARPFTVGGMALMAGSFVALMMIPVNFDYWLSP